MKACKRVGVSVSIVIPVLNEAQALPRILTAVEQLQQGFETEIRAVVKEIGLDAQELDKDDF